MLFYSVEGVLINDQPQSEDSLRARREAARKISIKTDQFCRKHCQTSFYFAAGISDGLMTLGIISERPDAVETTLQAYLKHIGCPLQDTVITEVTIGSIEQLLGMACHNGYIADNEEICIKYGLDWLSSPHIEFGDNTLEDRQKNEIFEKARRFLLNETLVPELQRIYEFPAPEKIYGHPVHYMIQTNDVDTRREVTRLLLQALYNNGRLMSKRYSFLDLRPGEKISSIAFNALYRVSAGGAVVVRYQANDDSEENNFASGEQDTIEQICKIAKQHRNQVLTLLCLPRECNRAKAIFYENLGAMTFVEVREDYVNADQARNFLKMLAREQHIRTDKKLFAQLEEDQTYLASDLRDIFDEWYNNKLKTTIYPQYRDLYAAAKKSAKSAPRGSAYDELQAMIGLTEAKAVIQKALNFYKIQKLYEDRGVKKGNPAMHMVFTGNPGTAKTTTARLFARIMKDNGLLSRGQLVEVGRGDLVGKYVGWTAQTVQAKFKEAMGGVLFIDEAYSLVDGHSGSYGDEAINTIVQEMENHREDVVVIFAGYPREMADFLRKNPGLRSRIAFHVPFADYTPEELCRIAALMGKGKGISFEDAALKKLERIFRAACTECDFGNGRYVRNILEQAQMNQASRLLEYDFDDITTQAILTITAEDLPLPEIKPATKRTIGFAS